jgi:hypothetical protein
MRSKLCLALVCLALCQTSEVGAQVKQIRIGGTDGLDWEEQTLVNLMVDNVTSPGALQPLELKPDVNVVTQLRHWTRYRQPIDIDYFEGMPRVWRAIGDVSRPGHVSNPTEFIDGDIETYYEGRDFQGNGGLGGIWGEFYTLDMGMQIPADRFVLVPPEGNDPFLQEPYRPNYKFEAYELTATNDRVAVETQLPPEFRSGVSGTQEMDYYLPLDHTLASVKQNFDAVISIDFPLQYLRFFRMRLIPDDPPKFTRYALAELEVYGRGFVPRARWLSQVIDLGDLVNIGAINYELSIWRRDGEDLVEISGKGAKATIEIRTGLDDTPVAFHSYDDLAQPVEVTKDVYNRLKPRVWPWDPPAVGWQGIIADDNNNWSFWSPPVRMSGQRPRVPRGRYVQLHIQFETETLWDFARLDWLEIDTSPLLADRVVGEIASIDQLQPESKVIQVLAGELTEFILDLRAEFSGAVQPGFDAVRLRLPSVGKVLSLEIGEPLNAVAPDSIVEEGDNLVVYLPQHLGPNAEDQLRLRLESAVYGASDQFQVEVFARQGNSLPQGVEDGDASAELGTDQLKVLVQSGSLASVLSELAIAPAAFTPQSDGINDEVDIAYTLFSVLDAVEVKVELLTLAGQPVRSLSGGVQGAGRHTLSWDGRNDTGQLVAPGVYLVRIGASTDGGKVVRFGSVAVAY